MGYCKPQVAAELVPAEIGDCALCSDINVPEEVCVEGGACQQMQWGH